MSPVPVQFVGGISHESLMTALPFMSNLRRLGVGKDKRILARVTENFLYHRRLQSTLFCTRLESLDLSHTAVGADVVSFLLGSSILPAVTFQSKTSSSPHPVHEPAIDLVHK